MANYRISRFFLGVHRFAPLAATRLEMDVPNIQYIRWVEMIRYYNRVQKLKEYRLPKLVLNWDFMERRKGWVSDLCKVTTKLGMEEPDIDVQGYDLETSWALIQEGSRVEWEEDAHTKPKLRTYVEMRCFDEQPCLVKTRHG